VRPPDGRDLRKTSYCVEYLSYRGSHDFQSSSVRGAAIA